MQNYLLYKDLEFNELDYPTVNLLLKLAFILVYCCNLLVFPSVAYMIIILSVHRMSRYRVVILAQISFSFSFSTTFFIWQPKFFFPLWMAAPSGFFDIGPQTTFVFFPCAIFFLIGVLHAIVFSSIYRVIQTYPNSFAFQMINDDIWLLTFSFSTLSALEVFFVGPILLDYPNSEAVKSRVIEEVPIMLEFYKLYPSLSGYHPALSGGWVSLLLSYGCITSIILAIWFGATHIFFIQRMIHLQKHETFATWKLHRMLYRTLIVQALLLFILVLIPLMSFLIAVYFGFRKASIIGASLPLFTSLQALGELFSIVYFIRPYRIFVLQSLRRFLPKQNISRVFRLTPMPPIVS